MENKSMTANTPLLIHEFSTGINPDGTKENWISRGFTGQYMNSTLSEIPYNVERSIANDEFTVAESSIKDRPSMVGRVVLANGGASDWAVVAVITRGKDEYVRSLTVSRYFLAEGADSLSRIVAWLDFRAKQGRLPVYNPFDTKAVGQPNPSTAAIVKTRVAAEMTTRLRDNSAPLIIPPDQQPNYPFPVVDSLASEKARLTGQPASWAYNVEALEKPERFQIILPASDRAFTLIQQALANKPQDQAASAIDEKALKQAVKGLADNPTVKPEQWQTFVENIFVVASAFDDSRKASDYWQKLLDGQGASNALKQGIYTQPMIRLLTLRAIALPDTLPEFLQWLQVDSSKKSKGGSYGEISLEFQSQLSGFLQEPRLKEIFVEGTRTLVANVLMKAVAPKSVVWIFLSKQSLWGKYQSQLRTDLRHDVEVLGKKVRGAPNQERFTISGLVWNKIWREIQPYWQASPRAFDENYLPLANLFYQLGDAQLAAYFYQLSYGYVPSDLFKTAFPSKQGRTDVNGLIIIQQGYNERGERFIVPVPIVAAIAAMMFAFGFGGGILIEKVISLRSSQSSENVKTDSPQNGSDSQQKPGTQTNSTSSSNNNLPPSGEIDKEKTDRGVKNLKSTKLALEAIITELQQSDGIDSKSAQKLITDSLGSQRLEFSALENLKSTEDIKDKEAWVIAIIQYQTKINPPISPKDIDGVISPNQDGRTYKKLISDIRQKIKLNPSSSNSPSQKGP